MEQWRRDLDEQFAEWRMSLDDVRALGDQVIAIGTVNGRGRASGIALQFRSAIVFHFGSDDRITRGRIFPDVNEALQAVGLEE
jgi:ketosteroid isomerase-like protein